MYPEDLSESAERQKTLGVEVLTGTMVSEIDDAGVTLSDGRRIESVLVLWAAGVQASELGQMLGVGDRPKRSCRWEVDLSVPGHREVFVTVTRHRPGCARRRLAGDADGKSRWTHDRGGPAHAVENPIPLSEQGGTRHHRAGEGGGGLRPGQIRRVLAWVAWLAIHIFYLIGFRNRVWS